MKELTIKEKAECYDEAIDRARNHRDRDGLTLEQYETIDIIFPELKDSEDEQNILFEKLKDIHLRMEHQTVCNDARGNKMWKRAWQRVNEAINIIKYDKETFKW